MAKVIWDNAALDQIDDATDYIRRFDEEAATRIGAAMMALGDSLATYPHRGRPGADGLRELTGVPPYVLRYRVTDDVVHIVEIRHGRQAQ